MSRHGAPASAKGARSLYVAHRPPPLTSLARTRTLSWISFLLLTYCVASHHGGQRLPSANWLHSPGVTHCRNRGPLRCRRGSGLIECLSTITLAANGFSTKRLVSLAKGPSGSWRAASGAVVRCQGSNRVMGPARPAGTVPVACRRVRPSGVPTRARPAAVGFVPVAADSSGGRPARRSDAGRRPSVGRPHTISYSMSAVSHISAFRAP